MRGGRTRGRVTRDAVRVTKEVNARWDYHDPTAGFAGAPPARSALTLRLVLACFGVAVCTAAAVLFAVVAHSVALAVVFGLLAAVAVLDAAVIIHRKARGEPG